MRRTIVITSRDLFTLHPRKSLRSVVLALTLLATTAAMMMASAPAFAALGETKAEARAHRKEWRKKYRAIDPMFKTDKEGRVVWECWAGPPNGWTKAKALELGKLLVPEKLRSEEPKAGKVDGTYHPFTFPDGTQIVLGESLGKRFIGVEVRAPGFKGGRC